MFEVEGVTCMHISEMEGYAENVERSDLKQIHYDLFASVKSPNSKSATSPHKTMGYYENLADDSKLYKALIFNDYKLTSDSLFDIIGTELEIGQSVARTTKGRHASGMRLGKITSIRNRVLSGDIKASIKMYNGEPVILYHEVVNHDGGLTTQFRDGSKSAIKGDAKAVLVMRPRLDEVAEHYLNNI